MDLEVQAQINNYKELEFNDNIYKEAIILAAYSYIRQLYNENKISKKELNNIRNKYTINID